MKAVANKDREIVQLAAFCVGAEEYVVDIKRVRTIVRPMPVTPVRMGPQYVEGVINLRGTVVPLIDLRRRFGLPVEQTPGQKIVVMSVECRMIGLMVDTVTEVVRVPRDQIRPAPEFFSEGQAPFFMGICHFRGRTLVLLNVKNIISSEERIELPEMSAVEGDEE